MNEWEDNISFYVVFGAAVYRPSSMMVDYTDFEEERLRERKGKCFPHYITGGPPQQREEIFLEK